MQAFNKKTMIMNQYKKHIKRSLLMLAGLTVLVSCKKSFLEIVPKGNLVASTTEDYNLLLNNPALINIDANAQVLMGDEVASNETYFNQASTREQRLFRWDDDIYLPNENATEFDQPLTALYTYNKIINEVPSSLGGSEQQKSAILAEARAGRAWLNFILINQYGKPYASSTAANDTGFPIITEAKATNNSFQRASVGEVYNFIIEELTGSIPSLPEKVTFRSRMSKAAGEALLAKVYMFTGRFTEALPLLDRAFEDINGGAIRIGLYDYNVTLTNGGSFLPIGFTGPEYPTLVDNQESILARAFNNNWAGYNNLAVLKEETVNLYTPSDLRLKFFSSEAAFGDPFPHHMMRRLGPGSTQFAVILPDLYLLRAECRARLNDLQGAIQDVETLRAKRMPSAEVNIPLSDRSDRLSLIRYIFNERVREFSLQGYRWLDMRRLSVDPLFSNQTYTHTLFRTDGSTSSFGLRPERFTLRLPLKVLSANPGMPDNP
jgi:tetratricopeptide (TPR) repeat protein